MRSCLSVRLCAPYPGRPLHVCILKLKPVPSGNCKPDLIDPDGFPFKRQRRQNSVLQPSAACYFCLLHLLTSNCPQYIPVCLLKGCIFPLSMAIGIDGHHVFCFIGVLKGCDQPCETWPGWRCLARGQSPLKCQLSF